MSKEIDEITKWVKQDAIVKMSEHHHSIERAIALSYHKTKEKILEEIKKEFIKKFYFKNHVITSVQLVKEFRKYLKEKKT